MKRLIQLALLFMVLPVFGQTSAITATVSDPDSTAWASLNGFNATYSIQLVSSAGVPIPAGQAFRSDTGATVVNPSPGNLSSSGALSLTLVSSSNITPSGSRWQFKLCPAVSTAVCATATLAINSSGSLSTQLSAATLAPRISGGLGAYAYNDTEVAATTNSTYYNITTPGCEYYSTSWGTCGGGGSSGFPITLGSTSVAASSTTTTLAGLTLTSPTLTTPALGTPSAAVLTNATGLPWTGLTGSPSTAQVPVQSLTTTGSSGAATLSSGVLNIPQYSGGTTTNALTLNNSGSGASSGATFNGSAAVTLSYNTVGAASSGANSNITSLTGLTTPLSTAQGGTGAGALTGYRYANGASADTAAVTIPASSVTGAWVTPESYGAVGDGNFYFDGVMTAPSTSNGSSTTPSAPSVTTSYNASVVIALFATTQTWTTAPTTGTQRVNETFTSGYYGMTANDQTVATAGSVAAVTGTYSGSAVWLTGSVILNCPSTACAFENQTSMKSTGSTSVVQNVPSGSAAGDYMIGCVAYFNTTLTQPTGWVGLFTSTNGNNHFTCASHTAGASEPSTYTWTVGSTGGVGGMILDYRNGFLQSGILTSASAGFTSASAGKPICVAGISLTGGQACGTIANYISSTTVQTSFGAATTVSSAGQFVYGTDNTTAFQNMLTTAPCSTIGCHILMGPNRYAVTGTLAISGGIPITWEGAGGGVQNEANAFINSNSLTNANAGSALVYLTTTLSTPGLNIAGSLNNTSSNAQVSISHFSVIGGAGVSSDGGGEDGIDINNWLGLYLNGMWVSNFSGQGISILIPSGGTIYRNYIQTIDLHQMSILFNGGCGVEIGAVDGPDFETIKLDSNMIEANLGSAVCQKSANLQGFTLINNVFQWDNRTTAGPEISFGGSAAAYGCEILGNYFEVDTILSSKSNAVINNTSSGTAGCRFESNYVTPQTTAKPLVFSAATQALPVATTTGLQHQSACVSDAVTCVNGTTYASGGSTACMVQSNGTNWIETGQGCY
jgi:hypothetical protein